MTPKPASRWFPAAVLVLLGACGFDADPALQERFACATTAECVVGFRCLRGVCVSTDGGTVDSGEPDAGEPDAGEADSGGGDSGTTDAGDVDSGQADAGDMDAGPDDAGMLDASVPLSLVLTVSDGGGLAGECIALSATTMGTAFPTSATFDVRPAGGQALVLYSNPQCSTAVTATPFDGGVRYTGALSSGAASLYARAGTGRTYSVAATAGSADASTFVEVRPAVRRGTCSMPSNQLSVNCPIAPPVRDLSRAASFFAVSHNSGQLEKAAMRCTFTSPSVLRCSHGATAATPISISWQVLELPTGLSVTRALGACDGGAVQVIVPAGDADPAQSLTLLSGETDSASGNDWSSSWPTANFLPDASVALRTESACAATYEVQVAEFAGSRVSRFFTTLTDGGVSHSTSAGLAPSDAGSVALFYSYRLEAAGGAGNSCERSLRAEMNGPPFNVTTFSRGHTAPGATCGTLSIPAVVYERIDFRSRARVETTTVAMTTQVSATSSLPSTFDTTRTILVTGAQTPVGSGVGETSSGTLNLGNASASLSPLSSDGGLFFNQVVLQRALDAGASQWTVQAIEFNP